MSRIVHFEIPVDQPKRAIKFYETVFGWKIVSWGDQQYWLATTGPKDEPGIDGALTPRQAPVTATVNTIAVDSLDATLVAIAEQGGKTLSDKSHIEGVGWFAYAQDCEGNPIGVLQPDPMPMMAPGQQMPESAMPKPK